jgi:hypothetical protein
MLNAKLADRSTPRQNDVHEAYLQQLGADEAAGIYGRLALFFEKDFASPKLNDNRRCGIGSRRLLAECFVCQFV